MGAREHPPSQAIKADRHPARAAGTKRHQPPAHHDEAHALHQAPAPTHPHSDPLGQPQGHHHPTAA
jgi:hypothetical protein